MSNWGKWTFSSEAEQELEQLNLEDNNGNKDLPEVWRLLLSYLPNYQKENVEEIEEFCSDSSMTTDVDEEEWEDLKLYTTQINKLKNIDNEDNQDVKLISGPQCDEQFNRMSIKDDNGQNINVKPKKRKIRNKKKNKELNIFESTQDFECSQYHNNSEEPVNKTNIVCSLLEMLKKEEEKNEELDRIFNSFEITKEELIHLWTQLETNTSRLYLCCALANVKSKTIFLCQKLLLPWLTDDKTENLNDIIQKVSELITKFPEVGIKNLIVPLINRGDNTVFTKDVYFLQDIMSHLHSKHWAYLLQEFLNVIKIEKCHLPLIKTILESSMTNEEILNTNLIIQICNLISSVMDVYSSDREFGLLIITVINCAAKISPTKKILHTENISPVIINLLKNISENYKGSMRFKVKNSIKQLLNC